MSALDRPVTIIDIATAAGVSKATVSRALRHDPDTSPSTRQHVLAVARDLGYVVNAHAQALRSAAPSIVGAVLRDSSNPIYGALHVALQRSADARGMSVVALTAVDPDHPENEIRAIETLLELRVSGILICSATAASHDIASVRGRVPMISLASPVGDSGMHSVAYDERAAGRTIADEIVDAGHRTIAVHEVSRSESLSVHMRTSSIISACRRAGAEVVRIPYGRRHDDAKGITAAMESGSTVIACANDAALLRYATVAHREGISVPEDLSLVGCDHVGSFADPSLGLTSYRLPVEETAEAGVELMSTLLRDSGTAVRQRRLRGEFIPGGTLSRRATADSLIRQ
ncbi:LacI family DNA-binding transcriptional regulator [Microbacterium sp. 179-I 3D3 NHS]|uniref:LacI family DNA-binding transcriptional regulator n=1 Tax=Microbacterium sp. 179-I 3D3 NHS TaxID=3142382 RepID=UPI0039A3E943